MDEKKEFVLKSLDKQLVFTQLCREYGISTKTGYKWRERFLAQGYAGLEEESRKPKSNGKALEGGPLARWISVELLRIKKKHEAWGAAKILNIYAWNNPGKHVPARSTVEHLFDRAGYVHHRNGPAVRVSGAGIPGVHAGFRAYFDSLVFCHLDFFDNYIAKGVNCIILEPVSPSGIIPGIEKANKAGIPVISICSNSADGGTNKRRYLRVYHEGQSHPGQESPECHTMG